MLRNKNLIFFRFLFTSLSNSGRCAFSSEYTSECTSKYSSEYSSEYTLILLSIHPNYLHFNKFLNFFQDFRFTFSFNE